MKLINGKKGEEGSFKNLLYGLILVSLFGMLILTAVVQTGSDYGKDTSEIVGGSLSLDKFNKSIYGIETDAQQMKVKFSSGSVWSALAGVVVEGIFGIAKDMFTLLILPFQLVQDIMIDILGVPSFVTNIILAIFIFSIIFGIWRILKIGE